MIQYANHHPANGLSMVKVALYMILHAEGFTRLRWELLNLMVNVEIIWSLAFATAG
jgi:hypothetical protein